MTRTDNRRGFTLVEMLVVIAIIVILVAILVPTIQSARHQARMTECQTNLSTLVAAMKEYHRQYGRYPERPEYREDAGDGKPGYVGGFSELYPDFIDNWNFLVCPSDQAIYGRHEEAQEKKYSTYNGVIKFADDPSASDEEGWEFAVDEDTDNDKITYNWNGYDHKGWDRNEALEPGVHERPQWLDRGWRYYPRLDNRYVPEYTVVTHCAMHREFYRHEQDMQDPMIRLSGDMDAIPVQVWQHIDEDGASLFERQTAPKLDEEENGEENGG